VTRLIRRYPNRRLYDTVESRYISLDDLKKLVLAGIAFEVQDSKTHENVTRSVLLQILFDQESQSTPLFSDTLLRNFICFYSHPLGISMLAPFLENSLELFQQHYQHSIQHFPQEQFTPQAWQEWLQKHSSTWLKNSLPNPLAWNPWSTWLSNLSSPPPPPSKEDTKNASDEN
jgi:polyhydroxyalkanoate synthesis repressor PhaR